MDKVLNNDRWSLLFLFIYLLFLFLFCFFCLFCFCFCYICWGTETLPPPRFFLAEEFAIGKLWYRYGGLVVKYHTGMIDYNTSNLVAGKSVTSKIQGRVAKSRRNF